MTREYHILNLGAGVQSTELYLMAAAGEIPPFDYAICSDTQDEFGAEHRRLDLPDPVAEWDGPGSTSFYHHLDWMGAQAIYLDARSPLVKSSNCLGGGGVPFWLGRRGRSAPIY